MSITIIDSPDNGSSAQDDLWYIVSSDNSGQTNFKYVFDLYDNQGRQLIRSKIYPDVNNGRGYFNAGNVIKNTMTYDWFTPATNVEPAFLVFPDMSGQIGITYSCKIGEDYNIGASGITTLNMASGQTIVYNYTPPLYKRQQSLITDGNPFRFITNRPKLAKICQSKLSSEKLLVPFKYGTGLMQFEVKTYNAANSLVNVAYFYVNDVQPEDRNFVQLDIAPDAVNRQLVLNNGAGYNIINANTAYYTIIESHSYADGYPTFRVNIECCNNYSPINLYFMNQYGMFDTAKFNRVNKLNMGVTRTSFTKRGLKFASNLVSCFTQVASRNERTYQETKVNYDQNVSWKYKLMMEAPTDEEYEWLAELIYSPQIYMEINDDFYPVTITNTTYDYVERLYNGLKNFEVEVEVNQNRKGFRR